MSCFGIFGTRAPRNAGGGSPASRLHRLADLPAAVLADVICALSIPIELSAPSGEVYTNRFERCTGEPALSTQLANGYALRSWRWGEDDAVSKDTAAPRHVSSPPATGSTGSLIASHVNIVPGLLDECIFRPPTALRDHHYIDSLETVPAQAWALRIAASEIVSAQGNARFYEFRGVPPGPLLANQWDAGVHPDDVAHKREAWLCAISTGGDFMNDCRVRRASDGAFVWLREQGRPVRDAAGALVAYSCLA